MAAMSEIKRLLVLSVLLLLSCVTNGQNTSTANLATTSPTTPTTTPTTLITTTTTAITTTTTSTTTVTPPENCLPCDNVCKINQELCFYECTTNCRDGFFQLTEVNICRPKQDATIGTTTIVTNETTTASNETTAATTTTTARPKVHCKLCRVSSCKVCDPVNSGKTCTECLAGFLLVNNTCTPVEDKTSIVGPVVGGVIGGLVVVAVIIVIIIYVCKRRRRQELHTSGTGLENLTLDQSTSSPSLTKIDEESIQRAHDKITRYTRDPTEKHPTPPSPANIGTSQRSESKDLEELPIAPPPPTGGESYDTLAVPSPTNPMSYSPVPMRRDLPADDTYANNASILQQIGTTNSIYANTADPESENYEFPSSAIANTPRMRSDVPPKPDTASMCDDQEIYMNEDANGPDEQEIYSNEMVNHEEDQEIYANQEFEDGDEIYLNQPVGK